MTDAAIISGSLVDVRNVGTHKSVKLTIHVPEEHATRVVAAFGWPTGVNPVSVAVARMNDVPAPLLSRASSPDEREPVSDPGSSTERERKRRNWSEMRYAAQAALRCNDPIFRAFLCEMCGVTDNSPEGAAAFVRKHCNVSSRADIKPDTEAETHWHQIENWFAAWHIKERAMA